jgi:hypothetical protein
MRGRYRTRESSAATAHDDMLQKKLAEVGVAFQETAEDRTDSATDLILDGRREKIDGCDGGGGLEDGVSATRDEREETARANPARNNNTSPFVRLSWIGLRKVVDIDREMGVSIPCRGLGPTIAAEREAGGRDAGHLREELSDLIG